eukprot:3461399-Karenia_brevis.AAC.1
MIGIWRGCIFCDPLHTLAGFNAGVRLPTPENFNAGVWHDRASGFCGKMNSAERVLQKRFRGKGLRGK